MASLISADRLTAGYGDSIVLEDVSLELGEGGSLALLGRNGVGKTTLLLTLLGLTRLKSGTIAWRGKEITSLPTFRRAQAGLGWVPQERFMFPSLTLEEHLTVIARPGPWNLARVYSIFPRLEERRRNLGNQLSGGEQQMLAVGRALVLNPKIVLLDEPLEGLAPIIVEELLAALTRLIRDEGTSAILVEQSPQKILGVTDRAVILERGAVVYQSTSAALAADRSVLETYLGVTDQGPRRGQQ